jgi:hypothetical protein
VSCLGLADAKKRHHQFADEWTAIVRVEDFNTLGPIARVKPLCALSKLRRLAVHGISLRRVVVHSNQQNPEHRENE